MLAVLLNIRHVYHWNHWLLHDNNFKDTPGWLCSLLTAMPERQHYRTEANVKGHCSLVLDLHWSLLQINLYLMAPLRLMAKIQHLCRLPMQREGCFKRRNTSIPLARLFSHCSPSQQTCSFVLGFIPLIEEPGCPSVWPRACTLQPRPRLVWQLGLDWLPSREGLKSWSVMRMWFQVLVAAQDSQTWIHLTGNCMFYLLFLFSKPNRCMRTHPYITLGGAYVARLKPNARSCVYAAADTCGEKRSPAGSRGTLLYHPITMMFRQGHDQSDYVLAAAAWPC